VWFGTNFIGAANTIYGILLVLCIIFMPQGIVGALQRLRLPRRGPIKPAVAEPHSATRRPSSAAQ
jgi:branched-chain amino acid transport system permease protein